MISYVKEIAELVRYRELLRNLVVRDMKVRYKRSFLGFMWVMLNPLLMMIILSIVFSGIFKVSTKNYEVYVLSGIVLWNFFQQSTSASVLSLMANSHLIKKIYLPKSIFPLSVISSATINFVFSLVPLFAVLYFTDTSLSSFVYLLPVLTLLVALFSFGMALILSTSIIFFHDVLYIYDVLLLAWMYLTPIFYPESIVPEQFRTIFYLNPLYYYLNVFRAALYLDAPALSEQLFYCLLFSVGIALVGWLFYHRYKDKVVYYL